MSHSGNQSRKARAWCRAMLPYPCRRCGNVISPDDPESSWHAGHIVDDALGGSNDRENYAPEHTRCNTSAGGKLAQQMKTQRRTTAQKFRPSFWFPPRRTT